MDDPYDPTEEFGNDRITEVSIGKNSLISINIALYVSESQEYAGRDKQDVKNKSKEELAKEVIDERYRLPEVQKLSEELVNGFPLDESLVVQAALWQRGVVGLHLFRDGNHRTGLRSLRELFEANGIETYGDPLPDELREKNESAIELSKEVRLDERFTEGKDYTEKEMYKKDKLFGVWLSYFSEVL